MDFRRISLIIAESVDAWRIIPRVILILYGTLVFNLYLWYRSIPTYVQMQCDSGVLQVLTDKGIDLEVARDVACSVLDIVGGPTAAQSAFVTTIIGLSTGIFGLYVATGRKWERGLPTDAVTPNPFVPNPPPVATPLPHDHGSHHQPPNDGSHYGPSVNTPKPGPWGNK